MQFSSWIYRFARSPAAGSLVFRNVNKLANLTESGQISCLVDNPLMSQYDSEVLHKSGKKEVVGVSPQQNVTLSKWTAYLAAGSWDASAESEYRVLLEVFRPEDEQSFLNQSFSIPPRMKVKVTDIATPLAWKSGSNPFGIILSCSPDNFTRMCMAFMDDYLVMDDILEIQEIISVNTKGHPLSLLQLSRQPCSPDPQDNEPNDMYVPRRGDAENSENDLLTAIPDDWKDDAQDVPFDSEDVPAQDTTKHQPCGLTTKRNNTPIKPPNVLVYCGRKDSAKRKFQDIKSVISKSLDTNRYVIYNLAHENVKVTPWMENTALLVVCCERLYDGIDDTFLSFYHSGGRILSFGSMFDRLFVNTDTVKSGNLPIVTVRSNSGMEVKAICSKSAFKNFEPIASNTTLSILVYDAIDNNPVVVMATCKQSGGQAVLSQILLEKDAKEVAISADVYSQLKDSESERQELLVDILQELGIACAAEEQIVLSPAYMYAVSEGKDAVFTRALKLKQGSKGTSFKSSSLTIQFVNSLNETSQVASPQYLPVLVGADIDTVKFNFQEYKEHLDTRVLGQVVLYTDVTGSTMNIIDTLLFAIPSSVGLVAVADRQTRGTGRGGNAWLSPQGCAQFTINVQIPLSSKLGSRASFIQHMPGLAAVKAVRCLTGYEDINIRLKWPNDIYYSDQIKCGGVLVKSTAFQGNLIAQIGIGFNVSNSSPTTCINDIISEYNARCGSTLKPLSMEQVIGRTITYMEQLINDFQNDGGQKFLQEYYKYWLHSDAVVKVECEGNMEGQIIGLDEYGYLSIRSGEGDLFSVQSDGNSFDMMKNLIVLKKR